ncbi:ABC transporter ATP-binding protein [Methylonatrum kenyense]|uniref:ABC transporter ATP-binding protein n=1 Tax=Methylonatrum kenyense TaxID=455253 RepID=UPI0020BFBAAE|nr:ABC transporter ATP-binding protein [Methylonatrum kenyense]MCK8516666.1 ABC transporter ATP-binding protein [Methylonatrum kenyense]
MTSSEALLHVDGLGRHFGSRLAVADVNLHVARGEVLGLLGLNGAGKTTTLRMICGTLAPTRGSIHIAGLDLIEQPALARRSLGYLPEIPPLTQDTSVGEFLAFAAMLRRVPAVRKREAVARALDRCGLEDVAGRLIRHLSKGYQQRVGIAQAIVHDPALVVLDEPTVGLDPRQVVEIRRLINDLRQEHAVIFSSHILPEVQALCDNVVILHDGRQVYSGTPTDDDSQWRYQLRLQTPPAPDALQVLAGVRSVKQLESGLFELLLADDSEALDGVLAAAVSAGWQPREFGRCRRTLEQVFLSLTAGEAAA